MSSTKGKNSPTCDFIINVTEYISTLAVYRHNNSWCIDQRNWILGTGVYVYHVRVQRLPAHACMM